MLGKFEQQDGQKKGAMGRGEGMSNRDVLIEIVERIKR
jgi:hypothetical protein